MVIRKIQKERMSIKTFVYVSVSILIALWIVYKIFTIPSDDIYEANTNIDAIPSYQKGEEIHLSGTLLQENEFPIYTQVIKTADNKKYGLKSSTLNLNNYSGQVEIIGNIETIIKSLPVVNVHTIKVPGTSLIVENNTYFFTDTLLFFDFSSQIGFSAIKSGHNIIVKFNDTDVITIEYFACNKVTKNQNCDNILLDLSYANVDNFTSYLGNDYYRYTTGTWITFNKDIYAYIFKPLNDDVLLDIANVINIKDLKYILTQKQNEIYNSCKNDETKLVDIQRTIMTHDKNTEIILNIKGQSDNKKEVTCALSYDLWNNRKLKKVLFEVDN